MSARTSAAHARRQSCRPAAAHVPLLLALVVLVATVSSLSARANGVAPAIGVPVSTPRTLSVSPTPVPALWLQSTSSAGIAYFLFTDPPTIRRFDMAAETWLADLNLAAEPTAFTVDETGIYVAFGTQTKRFALDGSAEMLLQQTSDDVYGIITSGPYAFLFGGASAWSVNKLTTAPIDERYYFFALSGLSVEPMRRKIFGLQGGSPPEIDRITFAPDGHLSDRIESPYDAQVPVGQRSWVFPSGSRVVDDSGTIRNALDLNVAGSLGGRFDDVAFWADVPIVLRGASLISYTNVFTESGRHQLDMPAHRIFVVGDRLYAFRNTGGMNIDVTSVPVDALSPPMPGLPVDPHGLAYVPDAIALGRDGVVYLVSGDYLAIFPWSPETEDYLPTMALTDAPERSAYSPPLHRFYFAYADGLVRTLPLTPPATESELDTLPGPICGIGDVQGYVFVCSYEDSQVHSVYSADGQLLSREELRDWTDDISWSDANGNAYFIRGGSPEDLVCEAISPAGIIGAARDTAFHDSAPFGQPVRVAPDGSIVVLGTGSIFDAHSLELVDTLPNTVNDATWLSGTLFTIRDIDPDSQIQEWATGFTRRSRFWQLPGTPLRLLTLGDRLLAVTTVNGIPEFTFFADLLSTPTATPTRTPTPEPSATLTPTPRPCVGDCDRDGSVSVSELVTATRIVLGSWEFSRCAAADPDGNGVIGIEELVSAVDASLHGCDIQVAGRHKKSLRPSVYR